jgi:hypothetical protein
MNDGATNSGVNCMACVASSSASGSFTSFHRHPTSLVREPRTLTCLQAVWLCLTSTRALEARARADNAISYYLQLDGGQNISVQFSEPTLAGRDSSPIYTNQRTGVNTGAATLLTNNLLG